MSGQSPECSDCILFISISFWEKKILKTYKFWTISKSEMRMKLIRPIRLASLNSIWNDFVVRYKSLSINISRYVLGNKNKFFKARKI